MTESNLRLVQTVAAVDPDMPYEVVVTVPMPSSRCAEDLATAYRLEWAECPEVTVEVRGGETAPEWEQPELEDVR